MRTRTLLVACLLAASCSDPAPTQLTAWTPAYAQEPADFLLPKPAEIAEFDVDALPPSPIDQFLEFSVDRADLERVLGEWFVVSESAWWTGYHHVSGGDRTGTIALADGATLRWSVRPGGLATLSRADGTTAFLARERHRRIVE